MSEMKLKTMNSRDGYSLCTPVNAEDRPMFAHVFGDVCCLKEKVFSDWAQVLLMAHGINQITMVKEKKQKATILGHLFNGDGICTQCGHSDGYAQWQQIKCFANNAVRFKAR